MSKTAVKIEREILKENLVYKIRSHVPMVDSIILSLKNQTRKTNFKKNNIKNFENSLIFIHCGIFRNANVEKKFLK